MCVVTNRDAPAWVQHAGRGQKQVNPLMTDTANDKETIAQRLGWSSYEDAPHIVQNNIDSILNGPNVEDPFAMLELR